VEYISWKRGILIPEAIAEKHSQFGRGGEGVSEKPLKKRSLLLVEGDLCWHKLTERREKKRKKRESPEVDFLARRRGGGTKFVKGKKREM